jgi:hypothetical protein
MADIRNLRNPSDKLRKEQDFFTTLRLQSKLAQQYNEAVTEKADNKKVGITPVAPQRRSLDEEQADRNLQRQIAFENLRSVTRTDIAEQIVNALATADDISDLVLINSNWKDISAKLPKKDFNAGYFTAFLARYKDFLATTAVGGVDTGLPIPLQRGDLGQLLDDITDMTKDERRALQRFVTDRNAKDRERIIIAITGESEKSASRLTLPDIITAISIITGESEDRITEELRRFREKAGLKEEEFATPLGPPVSPDLDVYEEQSKAYNSFNKTGLQAMIFYLLGGQIDKLQAERGVRGGFSNLADLNVANLKALIKRIETAQLREDATYIPLYSQPFIDAFKDFKAGYTPIGEIATKVQAIQTANPTPITKGVAESVSASKKPRFKEGDLPPARVIPPTVPLPDIQAHIQSFMDAIDSIDNTYSPTDLGLYDNKKTRLDLVGYLKELRQVYIDLQADTTGVYDDAKLMLPKGFFDALGDRIRDLTGEMGGYGVSTTTPRLHRKGHTTIMLPREGSRRIVGRGVEPTPKPRYAKFGRYIIHLPSLNRGILNLKYESFSNIHNIPQQSISTNMTDFIQDMLESGSVNKSLFNRLDKSDQRLFTRIAGYADINDGQGYRNTYDQEEREEMDRFNLVKGIFLAGNNSPEVIKELQGFIRKFLNDGKISKGEGLILLQEISCIS